MITAKLFNRLFPTAGLSPHKYNLVRRRDELIDALNRILPKYEINSYLRICPFLANCGIETDYFKTTTEYASGWDYDISVNPSKARSLGNFKKGDGPKYKGSGLSQTTGGFNFADVQEMIGDELGIDVLKNPEILRANIDVAVESACIFWARNNLNKYADLGLFKQLSGIVNRGDKNKLPLHWEKRNELYELLKLRIPREISLQSGLSANRNDEQNQAPSPIAPSESDLQSNNNTGASVALTPTDNVAPGPSTSKVKEFSEKYLKHCPTDSVKNVCTVIAGRAAGSLTSVWAFGFSGKIFLSLAGLSVSGFIGYALYFYNARIFGWIKDVADSLMPAE